MYSRRHRGKPGRQRRQRDTIRWYSKVPTEHGDGTHHRATFRHTEFLTSSACLVKDTASRDGFSRRYTELLKKIAALCESAFGLRGNALPPGSAAGTEEGEGPRVAAGDDPAEGAASRRASRFDKRSCDEEHATDATPPLIHCTEIPTTNRRRSTLRENHLGPVRPVVWLSLALLALTNRYIAGVITQCTFPTAMLTLITVNTVTGHRTRT
ncbi:hypothetical protein Q5P01_000690 [Channa striata]|uniref:Uncharacterized protein n=1 Tax=Channa striata TaxID=64152 RepID=A0AA88IRQ8_CHASR|nr:hypothetical protein Q5P01_000690 [Channa striata]